MYFLTTNFPASFQLIPNRFITIQSLVKSTFIVYFRSRIMESMDGLQSVYTKYGRKRDCITIFDHFLKNLETVVSKFIFWHYVLAMLSFVFSPLLIYAVNRKIELMFPIVIPTIDERTLTGYLLKSIGGLIVGFNCGGVYIYSDGLFTTLVFHILLMSHILRSMIDTVNRLAQQSQMDETEIRKHFKHILMFHSETIT